jgi:hypothetical protein
MTPSPQTPPTSQPFSQLLSLIFGDDCPEDWAQDVWDMSPTLGETAARLVEALRDLGDRVPAAELAALVERYQAAQLPTDDDTTP